MTSLWDTLPVELQEMIMEKSYMLARDEYFAQGARKHEKEKKKQGRGLLTADMMRYVMDSTDPMEMLNWAYPVELRELELLVDPPLHVEVYDNDYNEFFDAFLEDCVRFVEDPVNKNLWITPSDDTWLTMFTKLATFYRKYNHVDILSEDEGTGALYMWLEYQKDSNTQLSREKMDSLKSLGIRLPRRNNNLTL